MENRNTPLPEDIADDPKLFGAHLLRAAIQEGEEYFRPVWYVQPNVPYTHLTIADFQMHTRAAFDCWMRERHPGQAKNARGGNPVLDHIAFLMTVYGIGRLVGHLSVGDPIVKTRDHLRSVRGGNFRSTYPSDPGVSQGGGNSVWRNRQAHEKRATNADRSLARFLVGNQQPNVSAAEGPIADMINGTCTHLLHPHKDAVILHAVELRKRLLSIIGETTQLDENTRGRCYEAIVESWNSTHPDSVRELYRIQAFSGNSVDPVSGSLEDICREYLPALSGTDANAELRQERMFVIGYIAMRSVLEKDSNALEKASQAFIELTKKHRIAYCDCPDGSIPIIAGRIMESDSIPSIRKDLSGEGRSNEWT